MKIQQLATFCAIISDKSMTTAGSRLKITQPTVSRQIKLLEAELGVQLLERGSREVKPTAQGQLFFDYAQKILNLIQRAESAVQSAPEHFEGCLRVATVNYLGMSLISPVISHLLKLNRKFNIQLSYLQFEDIIEKMKSGEVEVAVMPSLKKEYGVDFPDYDKHFLFRDSMVCVGSRRDISLPQSIHIGDLNDRPLVSCAHMLPHFHLYLEKEKSKQNVRVQPILEVNNLGTMKRVIESSLYWGFMPSSSIQKQIQSGRLSVVNVHDVQYNMDIEVYFLKKMGNQRLIEMLLLMLKKQASVSQFST